MPLDGPRAQEQLGTDFRVGTELRRQPGDLCLLRREVVERIDRPLAHRLAGGRQLAPSPAREPLEVHLSEQVMCGPQLLARLRPPAGPAQPLAVEEVSAGELRADAGSTEPGDGFLVMALRL